MRDHDIIHFLLEHPSSFATLMERLQNSMRPGWVAVCIPNALRARDEKDVSHIRAVLDPQMTQLIIRSWVIPVGNT